MNFQRMATRGCKAAHGYRFSMLSGLLFGPIFLRYEHSDGDNVCVSALVASPELIRISTRERNERYHWSVDLIELCLALIQLHVLWAGCEAGAMQERVLLQFGISAKNHVNPPFLMLPSTLHRLCRTHTSRN